ncbi:nucleotide disphospho-sugar-binding domain-containing protein [Streptomyces sp. NPDC052020]|uniref:nucleotide disphospho-sugar-binding domain-containing protein n=1 Tax=Streptomyces sp. NPDC052020 TaxID=3155677 RepID=UPI0034185F43
MTDEFPTPRYSIVILNAPAERRTRSTLPIAQELRRRGHRITYVTTRDFAPRAVAAGVDVLVHESCPTYGLEVDTWACGGTADPVSVADTLDCAEDIHAALVDDIPDLVLYDASARITARLLTSRWNRPAVQILPSFAHGDMVVGGDEAPRAMPDADSAACVETLPARVRERLLRFLSPAGKAGISPRDFHTKPEPLSIVLLPPEFQADSDHFDGHVVFVGPCIPERTMAERWVPPATDRPIVFLTLDHTFTGDPQNFLHGCAAAFAEKPFHLVIAADGDPETLFPEGGQPSVVEVHENVPQAVVLRRAAAVVCHADPNNVIESLYFNTPLVLVPTSRWQRAVADRVTELGLGVQVAPEDADFAALADAVAAVVEDPDITRSVREFQRRVRRAGGARRAADEIECYLEWSYGP